MKNKMYILMAFVLGAVMVLTMSTVFAEGETQAPAPQPVICQCVCVCCPNLPRPTPDPRPEPVVVKPVVPVITNVSTNVNTNTNTVTVIVNEPATPLAPIVIIDKSHDNFHPKNDVKVNNHPNIHGNGNTANNDVGPIVQKNKNKDK